MSDQENDSLARVIDRVGSYVIQMQFDAADREVIQAKSTQVAGILKASEDEPPAAFGMEWNEPPVRLLSRLGREDTPIESGKLFGLVDAFRAADWVSGACADWLDIHDAYVVRAWCDVRKLDPERWGSLRKITQEVREALNLAARASEIAENYGMQDPVCQLVTANTMAMLVVVPAEFRCGVDNE